MCRVTDAESKQLTSQNVLEDNVLRQLHPLSNTLFENDQNPNCKFKDSAAINDQLDSRSFSTLLSRYISWKNSSKEHTGLSGNKVFSAGTKYKIRQPVGIFVKRTSVKWITSSSEIFGLQNHTHPQKDSSSSINKIQNSRQKKMDLYWQDVYNWTSESALSFYETDPCYQVETKGDTPSSTIKIVLASKNSTSSRWAKNPLTNTNLKAKRIAFNLKHFFYSSPRQWDKSSQWTELTKQEPVFNTDLQNSSIFCRPPPKYTLPTMILPPPLPPPHKIISGSLLIPTTVFLIAEDCRLILSTTHPRFHTALIGQKFNVPYTILEASSNWTFLQVDG